MDDVLLVVGGVVSFGLPSDLGMDRSHMDHGWIVRRGRGEREREEQQGKSESFGIKNRGKEGWGTLVQEDPLLYETSCFFLLVSRGGSRVSFLSSLPSMDPVRLDDGPSEAKRMDGDEGGETIPSRSSRRDPVDGMPSFVVLRKEGELFLLLSLSFRMRSFSCTYDPVSFPSGHPFNRPGRRIP